MIATDVNRDGYEDILSVHTRNGNYEFAWLQNDGRGGFQKRIISESSQHYGTPAIADVDGDGIQELLVPVYASERLLQFTFQADGNFAVKEIDSSATGIVSVTAGDFDGDGDLDILTARADTVPMMYYENRNPLTPGDFNRDGDVDGRDFLAWQRGGSPHGLNFTDLSDWQHNYDGPAANIAGDYHRDGDVNGRDLLAWQRNPDVGALGDWQSNYGRSNVDLLSASKSRDDTDGVTDSSAGSLREGHLAMLISAADADKIKIASRNSQGIFASHEWLVPGLSGAESESDILAGGLPCEELPEDPIFGPFFTTHNTMGWDDLSSVSRDGDDDAYDAIFADWDESVAISLRKSIA